MTVKRMLIILLFFLASCHSQRTPQYEFDSRPFEIIMLQNASELYVSLEGLKNKTVTTLEEAIDLERLELIQTYVGVVSGDEIHIQADQYVHNVIVMVSVQGIAAEQSLQSSHLLEQVKSDNELVRTTAYYTLVSRYEKSFDLETSEPYDARINQSSYQALVETVQASAW